jgi:DNA-binding NarL/FixJ family response regulator
MLFSALIADPHEITRKGTRQLIEGLGGRVVTDVETASEASDLLTTEEPDLLVTELDLSSGTGLEVLRQIRTHDLVTVPLVLTYRRDRSCVAASFRLGAQGFVLKSDPPVVIETAIRDVLAGRKHLSDPLPETLIEPPVTTPDAPDDCAAGDPFGAAAPEAAFDPVSALTERERQVLRLTATGLTAGEIGERLSISDRTVEKHRENIRGKLDLENAVEMARFTFQHDLLTADETPDGAPLRPPQVGEEPKESPAGRS